MTSNAEISPDKTALVFCHGSASAESVSYAELDQAARSRGGWLLERCRPGDRVLLLHPPGLEFMKAFMGCLYAGVVPVPAPLPDGDSRQLERTMSVIRDAGVSVVLSTTGLAGELSEHLGLQVAASDALPGTASGWKAPELGPGALALLQYTSGSTSEPKGVMVTYENLIANITTTSRQGEPARTTS